MGGLVIFSVAIGWLASVVYAQDNVIFTHNTFPPNPFGVDLLYRGHAHVQSGTQYLRLTNTDSSGTVPRAWSASQVVDRYTTVFWEEDGRQRSFDTTFVFSITPSSRGAADGITFFVGPSFRTGAAGASFGLFDSAGLAPNTFAVEFDTFHNPGWDPAGVGRHIGIDLGSRRSNVTAPFDSGTGERVTARVQYDADTKVITVTANSGNQTATLTLTYDLKELLKDPFVRFGISAATGEDPAQLGIHDIHSWTFRSTMPPRQFNHDAADIVDGATNVPEYATDVVVDAVSTLPPLNATNAVDDAVTIAPH